MQTIANLLQVNRLVNGVAQYYDVFGWVGVGSSGIRSSHSRASSARWLANDCRNRAAAHGMAAFGPRRNTAREAAGGVGRAGVDGAAVEERVGRR